MSAPWLQHYDPGVPASIGDRYDFLIRRRDQKELSAAEHDELLELTDTVEEFQANRVRDMIELARLRGVSLDQLVRELGLGHSLHG